MVGHADLRFTLKHMPGSVTGTVRQLRTQQSPGLDSTAPGLSAALCRVVREKCAELTFPLKCIRGGC